MNTLETGKKTFSYQGAITFYQLADEMKSEMSILRFKTLSRDFDFGFNFDFSQILLIFSN